MKLVRNHIINTPKENISFLYGLGSKLFLMGVILLYLMGDNNAIKCSKCGSVNFRKQGNWEGRKIFFCKDCKKYFYEPSNTTKFTRGAMVDKECPHCGWLRCSPRTVGFKCPKCKRIFTDNTKELLLYIVVKDETKKCRGCDEVKHISNFTKSKNSKSGYNNLCKECARKRTIYLKYNVTTQDIENMLELQKGKCIICEKIIDGINTKGAFIDHDHKTGKVRGLLCRECNLLLGLAFDNTDILSNAIDYLKRNI